VSEDMQMGEIIAFVSKSERERIRLIREARTIYDSIFPPTYVVDARSEHRSDKIETTGLEEPALSKATVGMTGHS
jgi:hypothetical protein